MRILIADKLAPEGAAFLEGHEGVEVTVSPGLSGPALAEALRQHDGVVVRSAVQITADVLDAAMSEPPARLRGIARAGVGVDNIDLAAATRHGVAVMNSASASTITTAEHAFALMIGLARNLGPAYATMCRGGWDRSKFVGCQLYGRTLGVVGLGRIGRTMAERALAFGMKVVGYDPLVNAPSILEGRVPVRKSFDDLIGEVDVVTFHVPKTESTVGMLGRAQFERARPGLLVVNAARGGIIDEAALLEALDAGQCGGAAIDVYKSEPPAEDDPLRAHAKVLLTPHLGASTVEAQEAVAVDACRSLLQYLRGEPAEGTLNTGGLRLDLSERQQAFAVLARRMVALLGAAEPKLGVDAITVTVRGEAVASRADTIARIALAELLGRHLAHPVNLINAGLLAEERGIVAETVIASDRGDDRVAIELRDGDRRVRVEGTVYADGRPRVTHLDGYDLDMVPAGSVVLLTNNDEPGRIGLVGAIFGDAGINIAEMVIGRRPGDSGDHVAMMLIKLDTSPTAELIEALRAAPGIQQVTGVDLGH